MDLSVLHTQQGVLQDGWKVTVNRPRERTQHGIAAGRRKTGSTTERAEETRKYHRRGNYHSILNFLCFSQPSLQWLEVVFTALMKPHIYYPFTFKPQVNNLWCSPNNSMMPLNLLMTLFISFYKFSPKNIGIKLVEIIASNRSLVLFLWYLILTKVFLLIGTKSSKKSPE